MKKYISIILSLSLLLSSIAVSAEETDSIVIDETDVIELTETESLTETVQEYISDDENIASEDEMEETEGEIQPDETSETIFDDTALPDKYAKLIKRHENLSQSNNADIRENVTPIPIVEVSVKPDISEDEDPIGYEPIVHEEAIDVDIDFSDIDNEIEAKRSTAEREGLRSSSDYTITSEILQKLYSEQFGDSYLKPYEKNENSQMVTGNTNRLVIEETDLTLPGKNGLDLVIKRRNDNQDHSDAYSAYKDIYEYDYQRRYIYAFTNQTTHTTVYVGFLSEDQLYTYMYNGCYVKPLNSGNLVNYTHNGANLSYYKFEYVYSYITTDTSYDRWVYKSSFNCVARTVKSSYSPAYHLESRKGLDTRDYLYHKWKLLFPEVYLQRYESDISSVSNHTTYIFHSAGAFRDINGGVYSLSGQENFKRYTSGSTTFTSSYSPDDNKYLKFESIYQPLELYENGPEYNFVVYDGTGLTYYFYNTGLTVGSHPDNKQRMYIIAVEDEYGNMIRYNYGSDYGDVTSIIDTYGRTVNINTVNNNTKQISYYDDILGETKTITYTSSTLPASSLNNDSPVKPKPVQRFTVTDAEGNSTIYDSRQVDVLHYIDGSTTGNINYIPNPDEGEVESTDEFNIERIIYPTGAETRYRYKFLLPLGTTTKVRHGIYGVEASYDIVDGTVQNSREYSFTNNRMEITSTCLNNSALTKTVSQYNASGTLKKIQTQPQTGYLPSKSVIYTYDTHNNLTMVVTNENGTSKTINYTYDSLYPNVLAMENDGSCKVTYEYHTKTFTTLGSGETKTTITDKPSQITYAKVTGTNTSVTDYSITTELTPDNKSIQYERAVKDDVIKSQKKYEYDTSGEVVSIKQWTNDTNSDTILDENDDVIEVSKSYTFATAMPKTVTNSVSDVLDADGVNDGTVSVSYEYNIYGSPITQTDPYGAVTEVEYDDINRPVQYTMPNGGTREIEYNAAQNYTLVTDEAGVITKIQYDGLGKLKAKYKKDGSVFNKLEEYGYDAAGRLSSKTIYRTATEGSMETYTYDAIDRVTQKNVYELPNTLLYTENYAYTNNLSQATVTKTIVADGVTAATEKSYYNQYGQLTKTESIWGSTTLTNLYDYDYLGRVTKETDPNGNETEYEYNYAGQVTKTTDAAGNEVSTVYDLAGQPVSVTDANGYTTNTYYDKLGRAIKTVSPFYTTTAETKTYYDKNSRVAQTSVKRRNNAYLTERFRYDSMGNLVADIKNDGTTDIVTAYQYDTANRITAMITGLTAYSTNPTGGAVTSYTYNNQGYLAKITDPMGIIELYNSYDYFGNITSMTDKKGNLMYNQYGAFGLKKSYFLGLSDKKEYTYNNIGQLTHTKSVNSGENVEENYSYDAFGRLVSMESNDGSIQNYTYDANSNVTSYQLLDGNTITNSASYSYNSLNQLSELSNNGITASYTYDGNGNMTQKALSTGITINCEYNPLNIMDYIETKRGNTRHAYSSCEYAPSGELSYLIMQSDYSGSMRAKDFFYDDAGRLTMEDGPHPLNTTCTNQYTYDLRGNRTGLTRLLSGAGASETTSYTYTYDLNNRLVSSEYEKTDGSEGEDEYYYDNNGNLTSVDKTSYDAEGLCDTQTLTYGYDAFNRLISYSDGTTSASYTYNADNLRASKTVDNTRTDFVWNGQNLAAESIGNTINTYTYDITGVHIANQGGTVSAYYKDYHGNVIGRIDTDGEMIGERLTNPDYDAFGNQLKSTFTTAPFGYCGEYYDSESGLIYLRNRYYDSELGRFINEDPIRDGTNWYIYCSNNPVNRIDPFGLFDYNTRLSYSQTYNEDVEVLQNELAWLGYLDMSGGDWGYFGPKTQDAVNRYKNDMGFGNTGKDAGVVGLQTWTSLGLIYRTKEDIAAGVEIVMARNIGAGGRKQYKDFSVPINNALNNAVGDFQAHSGDFMWFYDMVKTGATWDIKLKDKWNALIGAGTYPGSISASIVLFGTVTTPESVGNITYGYLGTAAGFSEGILLKGGDFAAAGGNLSLTGLFKGIGGVFRSADSADDKANVRIGINWYNNR